MSAHRACAPLHPGTRRTPARYLEQDDVTLRLIVCNIVEYSIDKIIFFVCAIVNSHRHRPVTGDRAQMQITENK